MDPLSDEKIIDSWRKNATPWTAAVRESRIASRKLVTDDAIVQAALRCRPSSVLDIGCGEGWLARVLARQGVHVVGVDVVPELIEQAQAAGGGDFRVASYEDIAAGKLNVSVDLAIANFSLIGKDAVTNLLCAIPALLTAGGQLIVQTLHPVVATGDQRYVDGWRTGSWTGFSTDFTDPAPWYFRTVQTWVSLLRLAGFEIRELIEPLHPNTGQPASVIFLCRVSGQP